MKIKSKIILLIFGSLILNFESNSFARMQNGRRIASEAEVSVSESKRFGLGFSTLQSIIPGGSASSIAGFLALDNINSISVFLSLPTTSPFSFGLAGLFKRTISGNKAAGFHVGGGVGVSNIVSSSLGLGLNILGGIHFELPGAPQVLVNLDGGPSLSLISSSPSQTSFSITAFSPALGASVVYLF
jgi:hypothetical protein